MNKKFIENLGVNCILNKILYQFYFVNKSVKSEENSEYEKINILINDNKVSFENEIEKQTYNEELETCKANTFNQFDTIFLKIPQRYAHYPLLFTELDKALIEYAQYPLLFTELDKALIEFNNDDSTENNGSKKKKKKKTQWHCNI